VKVACTVLRGRGGGNAALLPDQPTALSRVFLLLVSFAKVSFPVSSVVSAVRRLMRGPLGSQ
jgi:hypothetical protein